LIQFFYHESKKTHLHLKDPPRNPKSPAMIAAAACPPAMKRLLVVTKDPRILAGAISAMNMGTTMEARPMAAPTTNLPMRRDHFSHANAISNDPMVKMIEAA
jgi:hypothetical protein